MIDVSTVLVVVPAYREADCIGAVVRDVHAAGFRCLVVDDGSPDDTARLASEAGAAVVTLPINLGVGGALRTGFRYARDHGYEVAVQVDADGQHLPDRIPSLLDALERLDVDMVIGSRFAVGGEHAGTSAFRRMNMRLLARVIGRVSGQRLTDPTSGFRAIRRPLLDAVAHDFPHHYLGDTFEVLYVARRRGYRIGEIPVTMRARQGGRPSADLLASARAMVRAVTVLFTGTTFDLPRRPQHEHADR